MDRKNILTVANDISEATFETEVKIMRERAVRIFRRLHINQTFATLSSEKKEPGTAPTAPKDELR